MISLMIYIAIIWVIAYCICTFLPIPAKGQTAIYILAGVFTLIVLAQAFGGYDVAVPRIR